MPSYLERYLAGEREAVWAELTALGAAIRDEPLAADAHAVARETMTRARANVDLLVERLTALGYRFVSDALGKAPTPHTPPTEDSLAALRSLEAQYGALPLSIEMWHEVVGAVDFMGVYPRLSSYETVDPRNIRMFFQGQVVRVNVFPEPQIVGVEPPAAPDEDVEDITADPLVIWPCIEALVDGFEAEMEDGEQERFSLCLAPDALHKANVSGGDGPHLTFGDASMDAPLTGDDWNGMPFISYLREVFAWGGFPGLRHAANPPRDLLTHLTEGLQPL